MKNQNNLTKSQQSLDHKEYPLQVRFAARRVILNAISKAKITDGSFDSSTFICKFPRNHALKNFFNQFAD